MMYDPWQSLYYDFIFIKLWIVVAFSTKKPSPHTHTHIEATVHARNQWISYAWVSLCVLVHWMAHVIFRCTHIGVTSFTIYIQWYWITQQEMCLLVGMAPARTVSRIRLNAFVYVNVRRTYVNMPTVYITITARLSSCVLSTTLTEIEV